jgi:hypothetical protein
MNELSFNRNEKQFTFNQIKGCICELNIGELFCNVTLSVGHEIVRQVNLVMKRYQYDELVLSCEIGSRISVRFYITSRFKNERWYTTANFLSFEKD